MNYKITRVTKHSDKRGYLVEFLKSVELGRKNSQFGQIYFVTFNKKNIVRGNHFHKHTEEWFGVIHGKLKVVLMDIKTRKKRSFILKEDDNVFVRLSIGTGIAHAFKSLTGKAVLLDYSNKQYDKKDTDRHFCRLMEGS